MIEYPEEITTVFFLDTLAYYEYLVQKWEAWAKTVKKIISNKEKDVLTENN